MCEFTEWAGSAGVLITDANYYDVWAQFLDAEYNEQREHPELYPA